MAEHLTVSTGVATDGQRALARDALQAQRQRLSGILRGLPHDAWGQPSRCAEWSVHQVVRHLCDTRLQATALLRGASAIEVGTADMDPRITPLAWMSRSAGETTDATLDRFDTASHDLLSALDKLDASGPADIEWVYGSVPSSIGAGRSTTPSTFSAGGFRSRSSDRLSASSS